MSRKDSGDDRNGDFFWRAEKTLDGRPGFAEEFDQDDYPDDDGSDRLRPADRSAIPREALAERIRGGGRTGS